MNAVEVVHNLLLTDLVLNDELKYCLVDANKLPHTITGSLAKPNDVNDFVKIEKIVEVQDLAEYASLGISIKASNICAIDIDDCFSEPFVFETIDERGKDIYETFKDLAYIEFSFSGKGMRILFKQADIENYAKYYYVKNSKNHIEYYQPSGSARYVTVTGKTIANNDINNFDFKDILIAFLDKYMVRPKIVKISQNNNPDNDNRDINELYKLVKIAYFKDMQFQNAWFGVAPGSGSNESELDFYIIQYLYTNITTNKESIKELFEMSNHFKTKDWKHKNKWTNGDYRYYNYIYDHLR